MDKNVLLVGKSAEKIYNKMCEKVANRHNMTQLEVSVLIFLYNNPEANAARDFVRFSHLSKSSVSSAIDLLIKKGMLIGKVDEADRRYIHLEVQSIAMPIIEDAMVMKDEFSKLILKDLTEEEIKIFGSIIDRISENIKNISKTL